MKSVPPRVSRLLRRLGPLALALLPLFPLPIRGAPVAPVSEAARALHQSLPVADLHVDPLFWNRDLIRGGSDAQVDLEKLQRGGVRLAIFGVVTAGLPVIGGWRPFTLWRGWPSEARRSRWQGALFQLDRLEAAVKRSEGQLTWVRTGPEAEEALRLGKVGALVGVEGAQALEGRAERVRELHNRGVFYLGPVHLSGNALAGASYPLGRRGGLSPLGKAVLDEMAQVGMVVDLAHLSEKAFWEVLAATRGPVMCSHTAVWSVQHSWRNLKDDQLKAIADRGGVVGIMLAPNFLGGLRLSDWVAHVRHAVQVMGIDHVALGSDLDGMVPLPRGIRSAADLPQLTQALLEGGFEPAQIKGILGGNFLAMLKRLRPDPWRPSSPDRLPASAL